MAIPSGTLPSSDCFIRQPLKIVDGIPYFSRENDYTRNYEEISGDHLASLRLNGKNPFIAEKLWECYEQSTIKLIDKYAQDGARILDIGVGLGRLLSRFSRLERYGIDISEGYLCEAQKVGINVSYSLVEDLPFRDNYFDVVVCTDVLEHVVDLYTACSQAIRVLKPEGIIIIRVPYCEDLSCYLSSANPYQLVHVRNFDEHELRILFERIFQMKVEETLPVGYFVEASRLRLSLPRGIRGAVRLFIRFINVVAPASGKQISERLLWPIEINLVARKAA